MTKAELAEYLYTGVTLSLPKERLAFAKAFSYLVPYDELLKKIKTAKAERIERIRILYRRELALLLEYKEEIKYRCRTIIVNFLDN